MDYKREIIRMVKSIKNEKYLMKIYYFVLVPFRKEKEED